MRFLRIMLQYKIIKEIHTIINLQLRIVFSNVGDVVLDPFSGSFTTSAVAVRLDRVAIGIDLNEEYFKIGLRRTGITNEYNGKLLVKEKVRKTTAKSKYVR